MKCETVHEQMQPKARLLHDFVENKGRVPSKQEVYKEEEIGNY
jgi:hypothetical protein